MASAVANRADRFRAHRATPPGRADARGANLRYVEILLIGWWQRARSLYHPTRHFFGRPPRSLIRSASALRPCRAGICAFERGSSIVVHGGLWRMLAKFAVRKAGRLVKKWQGHPSVESLSATNGFLDSSRSPSSRMATADARDRLIDAISGYQPPRSGRPSSEQLIQLAHYLSEGYDIPEIARRLEVARCTVYRWIELVRKIGEQQGIARQSDGPAPLTK